MSLRVAMDDIRILFFRILDIRVFDVYNFIMYKMFLIYGQKIKMENNINLDLMVWILL